MFRRSSSTSWRVRAAIACAGGLLAACGFHFPGMHDALPPERATLTVRYSGSTLVSPPVVSAMKRALVADGGHLGDGPGTPVLTLSNETFIPQLLAVDVNGLVAAYLLDYSLGYELTDAQGKVILPPHTVKLQRTYQFSTYNVLGEEHQQNAMRRDMRRDAIDQILRAIAHGKGS